MSKPIGGLIRLTSGSIGAGKSYINVKNADDEYKKGRYKNIYSNIRAHAELTDYVTPLPDDWRECEEYSLIIIDEAQFNEKFSRHFSSRRDQEVVDVTMIRHRHCDLWLITPNTKLMNPDIRVLVNEHWVLEINGNSTFKAFKFHEAQTSISKSSKQKAFDDEVYSIKDPWKSMYKTTEDGVASGRAHHVNIKLIGFIAGICLIILAIGFLGYYLISKTNNDVKKLDANSTIDKQSKDKDFASKLNPKVEDIDTMCRMGVNVDKPECVEYYNNLSDKKLSVNRVSYDPTKPYLLEDIQESISYDVTAKPVFSGCMKKNGKYYAYTQQATLLKVSPNDCVELLENNNRPFDYFAKEREVQPLQQQIQNNGQQQVQNNGQQQFQNNGQQQIQNNGQQQVQNNQQQQVQNNQQQQVQSLGYTQF